MTAIQSISKTVVSCTLCPRLVAWREQVAARKVKRFSQQTYWGRPVPGFGPETARLVIVGLAPAAHGANRTGRIFTGDRSGDWLYRSLHKFRFASQPHSVSRDDGLRLKDCYITAALRCAPPQNKPTADEKRNCLPYLVDEIKSLSNVKIVLGLGKLAFDTVVRVLRENGESRLPAKPMFSHGAEIGIDSSRILLASYHPSQQNTFTGRLTEPMFDSVFARARVILDSAN